MTTAPAASAADAAIHVFLMRIRGEFAIPGPRSTEEMCDISHTGRRGPAAETDHKGAISERRALSPVDTGWSKPMHTRKRSRRADPHLVHYHVCAESCRGCETAWPRALGVGVI